MSEQFNLPEFYRKSNNWQTILDGKIEKGAFKVLGEGLEKYLNEYEIVPNQIALNGFVIPSDIITILIDKTEDFLEYEDIEENEEEEKLNELKLSLFKRIARLSFKDITPNLTNIFKNYESMYSDEKNGLVLILRQPTKSILDLECKYLERLGYCEECEEFSFDVEHVVIYYNCYDDEPDTDKDLCEECRRGDETLYCEGCDREIQENSGYTSNFARYDDSITCLACAKEMIEREIKERLIHKFSKCDFSIHEFSFNYKSLRYNVREELNFECCDDFNEDFKSVFDDVLQEWNVESNTEDIKRKNKENKEIEDTKYTIEFLDMQEIVDTIIEGVNPLTKYGTALKKSDILIKRCTQSFEVQLQKINNQQSKDFMQYIYNLCTINLKKEKESNSNQENLSEKQPTFDLCILL